jgi:hypothetical protein
MSLQHTEAKEIEGLRLAETAPPSAFCRKASELDEPGLLGMQRQRKLSQPLTHLIQEAAGVAPVLEPDDKIIAIAHADHVARGLAPSPARRPEVERIVQVDVGKKR